MINGTSLGSLDLPGVTAEDGGILATLIFVNLTEIFNGTTVQCRATGDVLPSRISRLRLQGNEKH